MHAPVRRHERGERERNREIVIETGKNRGRERARKKTELEERRFSSRLASQWKQFLSRGDARTDRENGRERGERRACEREERGALREKAENARDRKISIAHRRGENAERVRKRWRSVEERGREAKRK